MEMRRIGGLEVSLAGLGTNNFGRRLDLAQTREVVHAALDGGVTLFDTADIYGDGRSEQYLGRALGSLRDEVIVASKFGGEPPQGILGGQRAWAPQSLDDSLRRLGTDHIDLYYYHKPDPATPLSETLEVMNGMVEQGKVREIACSNFTAEQIDEATGIAEERGWRSFVAVQNEFSLLERTPEQGVLQACDRHRMAFVPFFPLASGLLTGKYRRGQPLPGRTRLLPEQGGPRLADDVIEAGRLDALERLSRYAAAHDHSLLDLAMAWLTSRPQVASVIAGAMTSEQVKANVAAAAAWSLSAADLEEVGALLA